jgi:hypothetical protein
MYELIDEPEGSHFTETAYRGMYAEALLALKAAPGKVLKFQNHPSVRSQLRAKARKLGFTVLLDDKTKPGYLLAKLGTVLTPPAPTVKSRGKGSAEAPPCWHKRIDAHGNCLDCGNRAAIHLPDIPSAPASYEKEPKQKPAPAGKPGGDKMTSGPDAHEPTVPLSKDRMPSFGDDMAPDGKPMPAPNTMTGAILRTLKENGMQSAQEITTWLKANGYPGAAYDSVSTILGQLQKRDLVKRLANLMYKRLV